jgi:hypothetical protein
MFLCFYVGSKSHRSGEMANFASRVSPHSHATCMPLASLALSYSGKFIWGGVPENLRNYDTSTLYKVDCTRTRTSNH